MADTATVPVDQAPPADGGVSAAPAPAAPATEPAPAAASESTAPSPDDIWAKIAELDPRELIQRHARLQGHVGNLAQQQAQRERDRVQREFEERSRLQQEAAERERLRQLADEDPEQFADAWRRSDLEKAAREQRAAEAEAARREMEAYFVSQFNGVYEIPSVKKLLATNDPAIVGKLNWQDYTSLAAFMETVNELTVEHEAEQRAMTRAEKLAQARLEAMQRESRSFADEQPEGTDLGINAVVPGGRRFTRADLASMSIEEYRKHKPEIDRQANLGLIT